MTTRPADERLEDTRLHACRSTRTNEIARIIARVTAPRRVCPLRLDPSPELAIVSIALEFQIKGLGFFLSWTRSRYKLEARKETAMASADASETIALGDRRPSSFLFYVYSRN